MLLHEILTKSCEIFPNKVAVETKTEQATYEEIEGNSNRLAECLMDMQIEPFSNIAILLPKSIEALVGFFGCLKAQCCYIPMDTSAPQDRLAYIMKEGRVTCIITDEQHKEQALEIGATGVAILLLRKLKSEDGWGCETEVITCKKEVGSYMKVDSIHTTEDSSDRRDTPAYILYTSGSTGKPKGVTITHQNAFCFIQWAKEYFQVTSQDVLSSHAPFYFDLSVFDIYVSFLAGARLCLLPPALSAFPGSLMKYIKEHHITVWYSVPSTLVSMLEFKKSMENPFPELRCVIYAGEAFSVKYLKEWMDWLKEAEFYNLYGPTETNVITYYHVKEINGDKDIPIGRACPYARIYVVKEDGQQALIGERGELVVQSDSLMAGYYGRKDWTEKVITPMNGNGIDQGLYYHTGDLVEVVDEGCYQFICRLDHMVKLNGFRVELEEVEAVIGKHPKVEQCMVRVLAEETGKEHLQLLVQGDAGASELIVFAKRFLPEYMVPYDVRFVKQFAYTKRGKIDRNAKL